MNTGTPIFKIHKISIWSKFVNNPFLKYPIFMIKTTLLIKHMTEETD